MKSIFYRSIIMLLIAGFGTSPAKADTDQHCLSLCINNGGIAATCLPKCSYTKPQQPAIPPGNSATSTNDVFEAPKPAGDEILHHTTTSKPIIRDKDYICLNQCLHDGGQYDRCSQSCTKSECPIGGYCNGLLGTTPAPPSPAPGTSPPAIH